MYFNPLVIPLGLGALIALGLAIYFLRHLETPGAGGVGAVMTVALGWSICYALQLSSSTPGMVLFWDSVSYIPQSTISICVLIFALQYTGEKRLNVLQIGLIAVIPAVNIVMALLNPTDLFRGGTMPPKSPMGTWYVFYAVYSYLLLAIGYIILLIQFIRTRSMYRTQAGLILLGGAVPFAANLIYRFGVFLPEFDMTTLGFIVMGTVTAWAIYRYKLFDLSPITRDQLMEVMHDGMVTLDNLDRIIDINPAAKLIIGVADEPLGQPASKVMAEFPLILGYLKGETATTTEIVVSPANSHRFYSMSATRVRDQEKNITGRMILLRDITARRIAEDKVKEAQQKMESIINFLPDPTFVIDMAGKVIYWNGAIEQVTGIASKDIVGKGNYEYALPFYGERRPILIDLVSKPAEELEQKYAHIKRESGHLHGESLIPLLGNKYFLATAAMLTDANGKPFGAIETIHDITSRKEAEVELQKAKEAADSANQAKSAFLATMSHEIRTPMNGIIGMTSLLMKTPLSAQQRDFANTIQNSSEALLTIINDILDFSKIEAGKLELEENSFELRDCVESALDLVASRAGEKGLDLAYHIEAHVPSAIFGDVTRLRQILLNLLGNAVKFTDKGEVVISVSMEGASASDNDEAVEESQEVTLKFGVRDTGIGIPPDRMNRLFQTFSQVDASTTRKYGGTGLGLVICKRLSEMMGGRIWVESEAGKGTTFYFTLQARPSKTAQPVYKSAFHPDLSGKRILAVDDNATNRTIIEQELLNWHMQPVVVDSGPRALELLAKGEHFDLAILDNQMPDMDGLMLAEEIRRTLDAKALPLLMLSSGMATDKDPRLSEFTQVMIKPVKPSVLYNSLMEVFSTGFDASQRHTQTTSLYDAEMGRKHPLRILLAEDHPTNQKLALLILEELGYSADVASNGLEAIEALNRQIYDTVLMDVQMPEMDGLDATRKIRQSLARARQPYIIAMTANAMQGDREMCLEAGMDHYVGKPIRVEDLVEALKQAKPLAASTPPQPVPAAPVVAPAPAAPPASAGVALNPEIIDPAGLERLKKTLGKRVDNMLPVFIDQYFADGPRLLADARAQLAAENLEAGRRAVHSLKSASANFGAVNLAAICQEFESRLKENNAADAEAYLTKLESGFEMVKRELEKLK